MIVRIWGCRGSLPAPGPSTVRFGGNTSCISVQFAPGHTLILDAGTGIRALGHELASSNDEIYILTTHPHWDHIQGFPFFAPLHQRGRRVHLLRAAGHADPDALMRQFDGTSFPLRPADLPAKLITPAEDAADVLARHGLVLRTIQTNHPGGCLGYRLSLGADQPALVYLTDNELAPPATASHGGARATPLARFAEFAHGAAAIIHDAMFTAAELPSKQGWGHSSVEQSIALARAAGAKQLLLFHHDPDRSDDALDAIEDQARASGGGAANGKPELVITAARDGQQVTIAPH
jgi:phosphoribosyl 1,2-cyclic phosphodiesterase